jgi:SAM-dependent methyltransferase
VLVVGHGPGVGLILASAAVGPGGHVIGVDPSKTMRQMATRRCAAQIAAGMIELRDGTAEDSGCGPGTVDAVFSVNNAMLWDRAAAFSEFHRVLAPGGRLVLTVHRHVLDFAAEELRRDAAAAGLTETNSTSTSVASTARPSNSYPTAISRCRQSMVREADAVPLGHFTNASP